MHRPRLIPPHQTATFGVTNGQNISLLPARTYFWLVRGQMIPFILKP